MTGGQAHLRPVAVQRQREFWRAVLTFVAVWGSVLGLVSWLVGR
jgi:hypothetical protein